MTPKNQQVAIVARSRKMSTSKNAKSGEAASLSLPGRAARLLEFYEYRARISFDGSMPPTRYPQDAHRADPRAFRARADASQRRRFLRRFSGGFCGSSRRPRSLASVC